MDEQVETFNPWTVVNLVFHHLADNGLHPVLGEAGDPAVPAAALLRALGIEPGRNDETVSSPSSRTAWPRSANACSAPSRPGCGCRLREAIRRSTRSSTARNGSLHRTVRWAWSFSLRCTQSTVKSRPAACAAAMKSPRSLARVVCGGVSLAASISPSSVTRSTMPLRCSRSNRPRPRRMSW